MLNAGESLGKYSGIVIRCDGVGDRRYCYEYQLLEIGDEEVLLIIDARRVGNEPHFINHARLDTVGHKLDNREARDLLFVSLRSVPVPSVRL
jgi:hypothetical protein